MGERPHYLGHRERLRKRFAVDPRSLADYELLELILGYVYLRKDTKPQAKALLGRFKTLRGVFSAPAEELEKVDGIGPGLSQFFSLWREVAARQGEDVVAERTVFSGPDKVAEMALARLGDKRKEEFWAALTDTKNRLIAWEQISVGTVDQAPVYVREVMSRVLAHKAAGIILVHNHPGGDPRPSQQDIDLTGRIKRAADDLGVRLLDHVIIGGDEYFGFQAQGLLS